ncbi:DNA mismatch repair protein mlh1 [Anaeramoeba ignava]|uniref:DNA mismatch repair protein mlh1 n=1 Tax=Anaeramoeba ignava TaxID=1746090 RepID=A0A9Q0LXU1_ANAIG|nr:DNA mismatch repair protein mlh1 [Anaeramoeba ignava]
MSQNKIKSIKKLAEEDIKKIAAGELILSPSSVIKELIENSIDAKSSKIQIITKDKGMKTIKIIDNGIGIPQQNLETICTRFTTNKISKIEDLSHLQSLGFRGEALASISCISHIEIISKTKNQNCAYKASFKNGKIIQPQKETSPPKPIPCAGNDGTQVKMEDLFYNFKSRKNHAIKNLNFNYRIVLSLIAKFSIFYSHISFTLRKEGKKIPELKTNGNSSTFSNITNLYGKDLSNNLIHIHKNFQIESKPVQINAYISKGDTPKVISKNSKIKISTFTLFINNRLILSSSLKHSIEKIYSNLFHSNIHPYSFLSLVLPTEWIDVNICPSKSEIHFLYQKEIHSKIQNFIQEILFQNNSVIPNQFTHQNLNLLPSNQMNDFKIFEEEIHLGNVSKSNIQNQKKFEIEFYSKENINQENLQNSNEENLIEEENLEQLEQQKSNQQKSNLQIQFYSQESQKQNQNEIKNPKKLKKSKKSSKRKIQESELNLQSHSQNLFQNSSNSFSNNSLSSLSSNSLSQGNEFIFNDENAKFMIVNKKEENITLSQQKKRHRKWRPIYLRSIHELIAEISETKHENLTRIFKNCKLITIIDSKMKALIQYHTKLFLIDVQILSQEFFYQQSIKKFSNFGVIHFQKPLFLEELLNIALTYKYDENQNENQNKNEIQNENENKNEIQNENEIKIQNINQNQNINQIEIQKIIDFLYSKRLILYDYFNILITKNKEISSIPLIIPNYIPDLTELPFFLLNLYKNVDWIEEKKCFRSLSILIAQFYSIKNFNHNHFYQLKSQQILLQKNSSQTKYKMDFLKNRFFSLLKSDFVAPHFFSSNNCLNQVASIESFHNLF